MSPLLFAFQAAKKSGVLLRGAVAALSALPQVDLGLRSDQILRGVTRPQGPLAQVPLAHDSRVQELNYYINYYNIRR